METSKESWSFSAWRREGLGKTLLTLVTALQIVIKGTCKMERPLIKAGRDGTKGNSLN